ncbi:2-succinyl-5-enolpyruvyl-6-hydroxy-3-cyclohexene-1-carboxylic-acid synthase [Pseudochryseolinea flava]|uniref:2-succinyl-5-enolpyruvyl-6-hydroxy-3-cyclohexene-1-carboxylate synthase n=1 Tax=Pseudochryseolinea flava TaxID=2059302 RepID=A0A364Y3E4_9BACT|nr:2-succinyl-5-enolpyruvyl-6-hydroxy-3-cyclohexene-1-carboxylic-acid synthase [Pseudochryseolinea flava]RAW01330.1 2-succinyl-5-enolpyruvyl-6-hydroxy-3-cyclohexene-1-carboxylic-acid synthase [Pseudochryseolinea flava]
MNRFQPIYDIAALCAEKNVKQVVLCPGSRCAPLTLAFARHPEVETRTFSDERSAAFVALGIAQQLKHPVALLCTSGTAAYNFAPAVAEAFFSHTPLVIFTADRPAEWIAQHDGQTIFQPGIFGQHVKHSYQLPQRYDHDDSLWAINRIVNEAINLAMQEPKGPVHINAPFQEPLYPKGESIGFTENVRVIEDIPQQFNLSSAQRDFIQNQWSQFTNILVVAGQHELDLSLQTSMEEFIQQHHVPVVGDILSNLHGMSSTVRYSDAFLGHAPNEIKQRLKPDLLITFGKSVISKNLKVFLRQHKPKAHWHIQPAGISTDTYQTLTHRIDAMPSAFFSFASTLARTENFDSQKQSNYQQLWEVEERRAGRSIQEYFPQKEFGEFELVQEIMYRLPQSCNVHLANSMSVRYANFIGLQAEQKDIQVFSNRGTSGIDGCTSTAVGHALCNKTMNVLITGDVAFFYDRNAFWHNYALPNLRIVLLNNHGGIIFGIIDGPGAQPEAEEFFITRQRLTAKKLTEEFDFDHLKLDHPRKLKNLLNDFLYHDGRTKVLEVETDLMSNKNIFENFKQKIKDSYESQI